MTLRITSCTYAYRRRRPPVIADLTYELAGGLSILLGPNGAGKSTLLKLAASVLHPKSGSVTLDSLGSRTREFRKAVAWMPQEIASLPSLTVREWVAYVGWLKGLSKAEAWQNAQSSLARVELSDRLDMKTSSLSGGQMRRVGLAGALVHSARILLLDEPTAGLDPHQRRVFRDIVGNLGADGVRILLSTHDVADLAEEADHVTVLNDGSMIHDGPTRSFLSHAPTGFDAARAPEAAYSALLAHHGADF
ncbi:ABC transporter ATP-binding protein [Streptomyces fructofermentans]|uniref:ABC transporter ATP-binding protein n=1 Tax=Streptomyces fructofermentans TaxID=152141 RepID=A0A918NNG0_9ACTN|nr:ABC transporter ATP-binding protein [Streptomyces fructofermentans]